MSATDPLPEAATPRWAIPRLRWFILATAVVTAIALYLGVWLPAQRVLRFVAEIENRGDTVEFEYHHPEWLDDYWYECFDDELRIPFVDRLIGIQVINQGYSDAWFEELARHRHLVSLSFYDDDTHVTDSQMRLIGRLHHLEFLEITGSRITDSGMAELQNLRELQFLDVRSDSITDAGLASLQSLTKLTTVTIRGAKLNGEGLAGLKASPDCTSLTLHNVTLSPRGVEELCNLTPLTSLTLYQVSLPPESAASLARLQRLESVHISSDNSGPEIVAALGQIPRLKSIGLNFPDGRTGSLTPLADLPNLSYLYLQEMPLTDARLRGLTTSTSLETLRLENANVTGAAFDLPGWSRLTTLSTYACPIDDAGFATIASLPALREIDMAATQITDAGLLHLSRLPSLKSLTVGSDALTHDGHLRFRQARPDLGTMQQLDIPEPGKKTFKAWKP